MNGELSLVYILGAGHCGSTLLNLLLNGHSQAIALSEIDTIGKYTGVETSADNPINLKFWQQVKQCYETRFSKSFKQIDLSLPSDKNEAQDWAQTNAELFSCILDNSNATTLVDASKRLKRLYLLQTSGLFNIKVIHMVRDGRAVLNSYYRKYGNFKTGFRQWLSLHLKAPFIRKHFSQNNWLQLYYEQLATNPETTLRKICDFLGWEFEEDMLTYKKHPYVGIGGNRMRKQNTELIYLDESWKSELSYWNSIKFELLGGWLNKYYGY